MMPGPDNGNGAGRAKGYTLGAVAFHWITAALIAPDFVLGGRMVEMALSPEKLRLYSYHKWTGVTVFALTLFRMAWRYFHPAPAFPQDMPAWEKIAARGAHYALYALLAAVPLTGWIMSSAHGFQTVYLGVMPIPDILAKDKALAKSLEAVHHVLSDAMLIIVFLHAMAALKHHFINKDDVLRRMLGLGRY